MGEPYWTVSHRRPPTRRLSWVGTSSPPCPATLDRFTAAGVELLEMVLADGDSWDRYVASQWWTISHWLDAHPDFAGHARAAAAPLVEQSPGQSLRR
jgi:hypothetical protein